MLTELQKSLLLGEVINAFRMQYSITFTPSDFIIIIDKPNATSLASLYLISSRTDDHFRIKLYVTAFNTFTTIGSYQLTQEANYAAGPEDEIYMSNIVLDRVAFRSFYQYLLSDQYRQDIILATDRIQLEDGSGFILNETVGYTLQEF
jgi:hypothetical protein